MICTVSKNYYMFTWWTAVTTVWFQNVSTTPKGNSFSLRSPSPYKPSVWQASLRGSEHVARVQLCSIQHSRTSSK